MRDYVVRAIHAYQAHAKPEQAAIHGTRGVLFMALQGPAESLRDPLGRNSNGLKACPIPEKFAKVQESIKNERPPPSKQRLSRSS